MKTCLITGATGGIGWATAQSLAKMGHRVLAIVRDERKGKVLINDLNAISDRSDHVFFTMDLSSRKSIELGCLKIREEINQIDVLIHNAACVSSKFQLTSENIELQLAVNHFAPFLLNHFLFPLLEKSSQARVIYVTSRAHQRGKIWWKDLNLANNYTLSRSYNQSKLAGLYLVYYLGKKWETSSITFNTFHPGLVNTKIGEKNTGFIENWGWKVLKQLGRSPVKATKDAVFLATDISLSSVSGKYFHNGKQISSSRISYNEKEMTQIWDYTCEISGISSHDFGKSIQQY